MKRNNKIIIVLILSFFYFISLSQSTTIIYNNNTSTIDGVPFFPKGVYAVNPENMAGAASHGFNVVQSYQQPTLPDDQMQAYMDTALSHGLYVLFGMDKDKVKNDVGGSNIQALKDRVSMFKDHPALWGWYLSDEPGLQGVTPERLKACFAAIKETDTNHPVFTSNWSLGEYHEGTDIDMRQLYHGNPSEMKKVYGNYLDLVNNVNVSWLAIVNGHRGFGGDKEDIDYADPACYYQKPGGGVYEPGDPEYAAIHDRAVALSNYLDNPFANGVTDNAGKSWFMGPGFPESKDRIKGQVASAIAYGSNAVFWWLYQNPSGIDPRWGWYTIFHYYATKPVIKDIIKEIEAVEPIVLETKVKDSLMIQNGLAIRYVKDASDKEVLVIVNETPDDFSGLIDVSSVTSTNTFYLAETGASIDINTQPVTVNGESGLFLLSDQGVDIISEGPENSSFDASIHWTSSNKSGSIIFNVSVPHGDNISLTVYNLKGCMVWNYPQEISQPGNQTIQWKFNPKTAKGIYFVVLKQQSGLRIVRSFSRIK